MDSLTPQQHQIAWLMGTHLEQIKSSATPLLEAQAIVENLFALTTQYAKDNGVRLTISHQDAFAATAKLYFDCAITCTANQLV